MSLRDDDKVYFRIETFGKGIDHTRVCRIAETSPLSQLVTLLVGEARTTGGVLTQSGYPLDSTRTPKDYGFRKGVGGTVSLCFEYRAWVAEELVRRMCPSDGRCPHLNDPWHQAQYRHTCTFRPCPYRGVTGHDDFFDHPPGDRALQRVMQLSAVCDETVRRVPSPYCARCDAKPPPLIFPPNRRATHDRNALLVQSPRAPTVRCQSCGSDIPAGAMQCEWCERKFFSDEPPLKKELPSKQLAFSDEPPLIGFHVLPKERPLSPAPEPQRAAAAPVTRGFTPKKRPPPILAPTTSPVVSPLMRNNVKLPLPTGPPPPPLESPVQHFPNAVPNTVCLSTVAACVTRLGLTKENTLFAHSTCPDDPGDITRLFHHHWGGREMFLMGGLGGIPYCGRTGFGAFTCRGATKNENVFVLFAPHVAVSATGTCFHTPLFTSLLTTLDNDDLDEDDFQMNYMKREVGKQRKRLERAAEPMVELAHVMFQIVEAAMFRVIGIKGWGSTTATAKMVVLGGIHINNNCFLPLTFEMHELAQIGEETNVTDLMSEFRKK